MFENDVYRFYSLFYCNGMEAHETESKEQDGSATSNRLRITSARDARNRKVRGLWKRGERYYAQVRVSGEKSARKIPLTARSLAEAKVEMARRRTEAREGALPKRGVKPHLADFARDYLEFHDTICQTHGIKVLFLDNLSTLFSGVAENENDDWEKVLPWLLHLRRLNIAVVIIHHAGRKGAHMRGASRREDAAAWVLRLDDALDAASVKRGARFVSVFTKPSRHTPAEVPSIEWEFSLEKRTGRCEVSFCEASGIAVFPRH